MISLGDDDFLVVERAAEGSIGHWLEVEKEETIAGATSREAEAGLPSKEHAGVDKHVPGGGGSVGREAREQELQGMTVVQLKEMCKELGIVRTGRKADLIARIILDEDRRNQEQSCSGPLPTRHA